MAPEGPEARRRNLGDFEHVTPMTGPRQSAHSAKELGRALSGAEVMHY
jgi:hypothetical protein